MNDVILFLQFRSDYMKIKLSHKPEISAARKNNGVFVANNVELLGSHFNHTFSLRYSLTKYGICLSAFAQLARGIEFFVAQHL